MIAGTVMSVVPLLLLFLVLKRCEIRSPPLGSIVR